MVIRLETHAQPHPDYPGLKYGFSFWQSPSSDSKPRGSMFIVTAQQARLWRRYADAKCLSKESKNFLEAVLRTAEQTGVGRMQDDEEVWVFKDEVVAWLRVGGRRRSDGYIKNRCRELTAAGVLIRGHYRHRRAKNPADVFSIGSLGAIEQLPSYQAPVPYKRDRDNERFLEDLVEGSDVSTLSADQLPYAHHERLWNNCFGAAMRASARAKLSTDTHNEVSYPYKGERIRMRATSTRDSEIMHIDDQRFLRAIITYLCEIIREKREEGVPNDKIKNEFGLDIVRLLKIMKLDVGGGNRERVRKSMHRMRSTNFTIMVDTDKNPYSQFVSDFRLGPSQETQSQSDMQGAFSSGVFDEYSMSFLTRLDVKYSTVSEKDKAGNVVCRRLPRYYVISVDPITFEGLIRTDVHSTYIDNLNVLSISDGILHQLYGWCSYSVSRNKNEPLPHRRRPTIHMRSLRKQILPGVRLEHFVPRLLKALKKHALKSDSKASWDADGENITLLSGYYVTVRPAATGGYELTASLDREDPVIGHQSIYNKRLESQVALPFDAPPAPAMGGAAIA